MTDAERIEELKTTVPRPALTTWQKTGRVIGWVCSVISVVALCVSVYATTQAWHTATCVNSILGDRAAATQADSRAHAEWAKSIADLLAAPRDRQLVLLPGFVAGTAKYARTLAADQAYRDAHPLGHC